MKIEKAAKDAIEALRAKGYTLATAESCTGGGLGFALTSVSGSSAVYLGGVVSYANQVKHELLGVPQKVLSTHGAVSEQTARAMSEGVRKLIGADISVSVTGIAGPSSDDTNKPVGLVYIAVSMENETVVKENHFCGNRDDIRNQTISAALTMVIEMSENRR